MATIFFSYRRADSNAVAVKILDKLKHGYRRGDVHEIHTDIETISSKVDRREYVRQVVQHYSVFVLVIGPRWLDSRTQSGKRRLDDADDVVRLEIEAALWSAVPIIPVLVRQAAMPSADALPDVLKGLASITPVVFHTDLEFESDMRRLYRALSPILYHQRQERETPTTVDPAEPTAERQLYLRSLAKQNTDANHPPWKHVRIETLGELTWTVATNGGRSGSLAPGAHRPVDLSGCRLDYTNLSGAELANANLAGADLAHANLVGAHMEGADLTGANVHGTDLSHSILRRAVLRKLDLSESNLQQADLGEAHLEGANLTNLDLKQVNLAEADLSNANLRDAELSNANLTAALLENAVLENADLSGARMQGANLFGAHLNSTNLSGVDLTGVTMDSVDALKSVILDSRTRLGGVAWGGNVTKSYRQESVPEKKLQAYRNVAQVNHDIAETLRQKGLVAEASVYRLEEQKMQRRIQRLNGRFGAWLFSWVLNLISGYGERLGRTVVTYLVVVVGFAVAYFAVTNFASVQSAPMTWYEALILSVSSFHGRGFIPPAVHLADPLAALAAAEAILGLFIELIFIASFSRRFLGN